MNYMLKNLPNNQGTWSNSTLTVPERLTALLHEFMSISVPNSPAPVDIVLETMDPHIFKTLNCTQYCSEDIKVGFKEMNLHIYVNSSKKLQPKTLSKGQWQFWENEINNFLENLN